MKKIYTVLNLGWQIGIIGLGLATFLRDAFPLSNLVVVLKNISGTLIIFSLINSGLINLKQDKSKKIGIVKILIALMFAFVCVFSIHFIHAKLSKQGFSNEKIETLTLQAQDKTLSIKNRHVYSLAVADQAYLKDGAYLDIINTDGNQEKYDPPKEIVESRDVMLALEKGKNEVTIFVFLNIIGSFLVGYILSKRNKDT